MRTRTVLAASALVLVLAACGGSSAKGGGAAASGGAAGDASSGKAGITAQATGTAQGVPDLYTVQVAAHSDGANAHDTLAANSAMAQQIIDTAKAAGVADADVQTTSVSLGPSYSQPTDGSAPRIVGYRADESFAIRLRDKATAGSTIDTLSALGDGVQVQNVGLSIDDGTEILASARSDAVAKARAKAEQLAKAAGVAVGAVRSITEAAPAALYDQYAFATDAAAGGAGTSVPIAAGSQDLTVTVTVVFDVA